MHAVRLGQQGPAGALRASPERGKPPGARACGGMRRGERQPAHVSPPTAAGPASLAHAARTRLRWRHRALRSALHDTTLDLC